MKYLVSACLIGECCKYNGGHNAHERLCTFLKDKEYVSVCPEVLGGLSVPRACAEIWKGFVITKDGQDVSEAFYLGAHKALEIAIEEKIDLVITQSRSPSCGKGKRYSGNFDKTLVEGNGIFVDVMEDNGYQVIDVCEFFQIN